MALLNFKHGLLANLPAAVTPGAVYITSDERAMSVDVPTGETTAERIRIGDFRQYAKLSDLVSDLTSWGSAIDTSKISDTAFYYCVEENALLKWNKAASKWVRINSTEDVDAIKTILNGADGKSGLVAGVAANTSSISALDSRVGTLETAVEDLVGSGEGSIDDRIADAINTEIAARNKAIEDAVKVEKERAEKIEGELNTELDRIVGVVEGDKGLKAQVTANTASINTLKGDNTVNGSVAKTVKDAVDSAKTAILGDTTHTVKEAYDLAEAANSLAGQANTTAGAAQGLAEAAMPKTGGTFTGNVNLASGKYLSVNEPTADAHATSKQYVDGKASALLGTSGEAGNTIYGALKAAADANTLAGQANTKAEAAMPKAGGAFEGNVSFNSGKTLTVNAPTSDSHAATKKYVDDKEKAIMGTENTTGDTVYGALKAAADAQSTANSANTLAGQANTTANSALGKIDAFMAAAEVGDAAIDTLKELQEYLEGNGVIADDIVTTLGVLKTSVGASGDAASATGSVYARIAKNAADISANTGNIDKNTTAIDNINDIVANLTWGTF